MSLVPEVLRQQALDRIRGLPQADVVLADPGRVDRWIEETYKVDPQRLLWHVDRAGGIGGSDVGVAAMELSGGADPFDTMQDIVRQKLFLDPPARPNAYMEIGSALAPVAREAFHQRMDRYGCATDTPAYEALSQRVANARPWMIGDPDDVVTLNGKRFVVAYRVSTSDKEPYSHGQVPMRQVFQMHQYAALLEARNLPVAGLVVAPYVRDEEGFFKLLNLSVRRDPAIDAKLIEAGEHCWQFVMSGELPPLPAKTTVNVDDPELMERYADLARRYASFDALASTAYRQAAGYKEALKRALGERSLGQVGNLVLADLVNVAVSSEFDVEKAVAALGDAAAPARGADGSYDAGQLEALLRDAGKMGNFFLKEDYKIGLRRSGESPFVKQVRGYAGRVVDRASQQIYAEAVGAQVPAAVVDGPSHLASAKPGMGA